MIRRIDHVSIAVRDLDKARAFFIDVLEGRELFSGPVPDQKYRWTTIELGTSCFIELIDPINNEGFVQKFLDGRGEGPHHVTVQVDDIADAHKKVEEKGVPTFGFFETFPGWKEFYIHPKHAFGTLIQFAEFHPLDWISPGYVPPSYWEFASPTEVSSPAETLEVRKSKAKGGFGVEIRRGAQSVHIPSETLRELIETLKRHEAELNP
ncbi:MAG: VOC family protein [Deltaproteobacteria bacterium]|nr:VOC family protein [Deltaproteobacteria bacterium]